jgi:hypothetical protein
MTDPAAPAPRPAAAVSAIAREVRRHRIKRTRRAPPRAGGRLAARLTTRGRNARGAPSFDVEAPSEAVLAIAGFGSFGTPFGLVPTLAAAGAFERRASAGAAGAQRASHSLASRWNHTTFHALAADTAKAFQTPSKRLPSPFQELPEHFQPVPKLSKNFRARATRRDRGPTERWAGRRRSALSHRDRSRGPWSAPEARAAGEPRAGFLLPATR